MYSLLNQITHIPFVYGNHSKYPC